MPTDVTLEARKLGLLVFGGRYGGGSAGAPVGSLVPHSSQYNDVSRFPVPQDWQRFIGLYLRAKSETTGARG
jgi:hypothetical protein